MEDYRVKLLNWTWMGEISGANLLAKRLCAMCCVYADNKALYGANATSVSWAFHEIWHIKSGSTSTGPSGKCTSQEFDFIWNKTM